MGPVICRALFFDLDGTLVDSRAGLVASFRHAVRLTLPDREAERLDFPIGPPVRVIFQSALGSLNETQLAALEAVFRSEYDNFGWASVSLYPGVDETLERLRSRGFCLFVVTNKPQLPTGRILEKLGLKRHFECVLSRDSVRPVFRDKVAMLSHLLAEYHIAEGDAVFIGDSPEDLAAAKACNVSFVGVRYGYGSFPPSDQVMLLENFPALLSLI